MPLLCFKALKCIALLVLGCKSFVVACADDYHLLLFSCIVAIGKICLYSNNIAGFTVRRFAAHRAAICGNLECVVAD